MDSQRKAKVKAVKREPIKVDRDTHTQAHTTKYVCVHVSVCVCVCARVHSCVPHKRVTIHSGSKTPGAHTERSTGLN